eukprot:TRINITY_DN14_c0_g1_i2.p1 TRINITY_DN14_c0_g1~~TRINITY_DN14_c0_g1_i2.p1  ORF type:complete len:649 (-),score=101.93 TRINITY_DN14_c0_g1_i2:53-1999(-)
MECLVDELWLLIFSHLNAYSLCSISQTCRSFSFIAQDKYLWSALLAKNRKKVILAPAWVPRTPKELFRWRTDFDTIKEALQAASADIRDQILVSPGVYKESLKLDKAVDLIGEGPLGTTIIEGSGNNTVTCEAAEGTIQNLTLRQSDHWFCVAIEKGNIHIKNNQISNSTLSSIKVGRDSSPLISHNLIHNSNEAGVAVFGGMGVIEYNEFTGNRYGSVEIVYSSANPIIRFNEIHHNKGYAIHIHTQAQCLVENNLVHSNETDGIACWGNCNPTIRCNKIYNNKGDGIYIHEGGGGVYEENDIFCQKLDGIRISKSSPSISRNTIHHNEGDGIRLVLLANPVIRGNRIFENQRVGLHSYRESKGICQRNLIIGNKNAGAQIYGGSQTLLAENKILGNRCSGIYVSDRAEPSIKLNEIAFNGDSGVEVVSGSKAKIFDHNQIHHNFLSGVAFYPDSKPYLLEQTNRIFENGNAIGNTSLDEPVNFGMPDEAALMDFQVGETMDIDSSEGDEQMGQYDLVEREGKEMYLQPIKKGDTDMVSFLVEKAIAAQQCTFVYTKEYYHSQHWYECRTCSQTRQILGFTEISVCEVCARLCHKNHELSPRKFGHFYCDCGQNNNTNLTNSCKCITSPPSKSNISILNTPVNSIQS